MCTDSRTFIFARRKANLLTVWALRTYRYTRHYAEKILIARSQNPLYTFSIKDPLEGFVLKNRDTSDLFHGNWLCPYFLLRRENFSGDTTEPFVV